MANIRSYVATIVDTTTNATVGSFNAAEGQLPSTVNNSMRQYAADVKTFANELPWYDIGHTPTRTGNTTFTIPTDVTAIYTADRRLKLGDSTTLYATVVSSAFGAVTTITVVVDGGTALSASLATVAYAIEDPSNVSAPASFGRKNYALTTGTSTAYVAAFTPPLPALVNGVHTRIRLHTTCGAAPTLARDGLTAKTIVRPGNVAINSGEMTADSVLSLTYVLALDKWVINGQPSSSATGYISSLITADPNPAVKDTLYGCNTTGAGFTMTMPASPANGDKFYFDDAGGTWHSNNLTINPNGNTINGESGNMICNIRYASFGLIFWTGLGYRIF